MFDSGVASIPPPNVPEYSSRRVALVSDSAPGDISFAPPAFSHDALQVGAADTVFHTLQTSNLTAQGSNIETLLHEAETNRLFPAELTDANFTPASVTTRHLSSTLPVNLGGTGVQLDESHAGMLGVGAGSGPVTFAPDLAWVAHNGGNALSVHGDIRINNATDDPDDFFYLTASNGGLHLKDGWGTLDINLMAYKVGARPRVVLAEPSPFTSDTEITIDWEITDPDTDTTTLYLAWYALPDIARLPKDVALAQGSVGSRKLDIAAGGYSGAFTLPDLEPITEYVVRATVLDRRGNLADVTSLPVRTTELAPPVVAGVHSFVTSPSQLCFTSSNEPDTSDMIFVSGVLTSDEPALTVADVLAHKDAFSVRGIPAHTACNITVCFPTAHDPNDLGGSPVQVSEAVTYYPFVFYQDAESNATLYHPPAIYNPDVTAPVFDAPLSFAGASADTIDIDYSFFDAVGVASARAYVSLLDSDPVVPDVATVLAQGDAIPSIGPATLCNYHSTGTAARLLHTTHYAVYIAAADAAGNESASSNAAADTLDGSPPVVSLSLSYDGYSNAVVSWEAEDDGTHASVTAVHVLSSSNDHSSYTPQEIATAPGTQTFTTPVSTATFRNVPAYESTFIHVVAEDNASAFGNISNILSAVASAAMMVPEVETPFIFEQTADTYHIQASSGTVLADQGPIRAYLVLYKSGEEPLNAESIDFLSPSISAASVVIGDDTPPELVESSVEVTPTDVFGATITLSFRDT